MEYPAPKLVLPIFNPADFNATINTTESSFTPEEQAEIDAMIDANQALMTQIAYTITNLGKSIYFGNGIIRQTVPGSPSLSTPVYTSIFTQSFTPGTYLFSCSIPFSCASGQRSPVWTNALLSGNSTNTLLAQNALFQSPVPTGNAFIGSCDWVGILQYTTTTLFSLAIAIVSSGGVNDQWFVGPYASFGLTPLSPGATQNMIRCVQIK
jgi:hypothetical protein